MIAVVDEDYLYLLEFVDRRGLEKEIETLRKRLKIAIIPGHTRVTDQIGQELAAYFNGTSLNFTTPCLFLGSSLR
jgi:AraC family transcriptional regulator of adaptative response/methylated-DNA-[protein]-cysteine methyltransferase